MRLAGELVLGALGGEDGAAGGAVAQNRGAHIYNSCNAMNVGRRHMCALLSVEYCVGSWTDQTTI